MITLLRLAAVIVAGVAALGYVAATPHAADPHAAAVIPAAVRAAESSPAVQSPAVQSPAVQSPAVQSDSWRSDSDSGSCEYVAAPGYVHGDGGGQVIQDDGHAYMGCGDGPIVSLDDVDGDSATFSLHGDRVRVREGTTERLGPYRVHVIDVRGERVELELTDPG